MPKRERTHQPNEEDRVDKSEKAPLKAKGARAAKSNVTGHFEGTRRTCRGLLNGRQSSLECQRGREPISREKKIAGTSRQRRHSDAFVSRRPREQPSAKFRNFSATGRLNRAVLNGCQSRFECKRGAEIISREKNMAGTKATLNAKGTPLSLVGRESRHAKRYQAFHWH